MADDYRVQLDMYSGPMDLLLYLIRREEIDIYDIPIVKITEQYVQYVELLQQIDPDVAGEFLVLASMLMEIKSRMLLPKPPPESEEEFVDPRLELVRQLLEYKKFKDAAEQLRDAAEEHAQRYPRHPAEMQPEPKDTIEIDSLHMWDLVDAFRDVMAKVGRLRPHEVQYDDTPVSLHAADMVDRLEREGSSMLFADIFEGRTRSECIGLFLALLELIRQRRVRAEQERPFAPIYIHLLDATPIEAPEDARPVFGTFAPGTESASNADETDAADATEDDDGVVEAIDDEVDALGAMPDVDEFKIEPPTGNASGHAEPKSSPEPVEQGDFESSDSRQSQDSSGDNDEPAPPPDQLPH